MCTSRECICKCVLWEMERSLVHERERERESDQTIVHVPSVIFTSVSAFLFNTLSFIYERFMDAGGWPMLNMWLVEAKKAQNTALLIELLQVLKFHTQNPTHIQCILYTPCTVNLVTGFDLQPSTCLV